ncbi:unnamed protein product [Urochloa decumbens]|uniref:Uncharacterized protein n=1 Tax=Urochloa decumbens TaxID=240449 RepID=A0ABC8YZZ9_9POAL
MTEKIMMPHEQLASPLLPVPVEKQQQQQKPSRAFPPFPAVRLVSLWGLFNAGVLFLSFAITCTLAVVYTNPSDLPSWLLQPADLTEAEVATASALMLGTIWGTVIQAAAATPALLLPARRRRTRRALAYTVLAAAVASHCMYVSALGIYRTTGPGYPAFIRINCFVCFFILAVSDLLCFLALLVGSDE